MNVKKRKLKCYLLGSFRGQEFLNCGMHFPMSRTTLKHRIQIFHPFHNHVLQKFQRKFINTFFSRLRALIIESVFPNDLLN